MIAGHVRGRVERSRRNVIRVASLSKTHSVPGMKLGWIVAHPDFIRGYYEYASTTYGGPPSLFYLLIEMAARFEQWDVLGLQALPDGRRHAVAVGVPPGLQVTQELPALLAQQLPIDSGRLGLSGHSMGGHGALTLALRHPGLFKSLSAFAPICAPTQCPWGQKAFAGYLGTDSALWREHDASELMARAAAAPFPDGILIDQGLADKFLEAQLHPHLFEHACAAVKQPLTLRRHAGYDHGYYFISTFINDHLDHHARILLRG